MTKFDDINASTATPATSALSIDAHPSSIEALGIALTADDGPESMTYAAGRHALRELTMAASEMDAANVAARQKHGVGTFVVHGRTSTKALPPEEARALAAAMQTRFDRAAKHFDANLGAVSQTVDALGKRIDSTLATTQRDAMAASIASDLRALARSQKQPLAYVLGAIAEDDIDTVRAVLNAPPRLSGLNKDDVALIREKAAQRFASADFGKLAAAKNLHAHLTRASESFVKQYMKMRPSAPDDAATKARDKLREAAQ